MEPLVIEASGTPREIGRAHGEHARELIRSGVDRWREALSSGGKDADRLWHDLSRTAGFRAAAAHWTPDLLEEVEGIAEGAAVDADVVFATNCLDEAWWWHEKGPGCSVVAVADRGPVPVIGQTMDLDTWMDTTQVVLRLRHPDGLEQVLLSRAGVIGLCGANSAGLGVVVNALDQLAVDPTGVPVAFVLRSVLAARRLADVPALLHRLPHASGQAYTAASPDGVAGFECGADVVTEYLNDPARPGARWHTNHPLAATADEAARLRGAAEGEASWDWAAGSSVPRMSHLDTAMATVATADDVVAVLSDSDAGICMYPGRWRPDGFTFGSVVVEATVPPRIRVAVGPPDRVRYVDVPFGLPVSDRTAT
ncbi:MAG TPA: C45 family peptidase [Actinomycetes bacterium]|nr:C45 family peptidase [Actinomycetes bacterium]